MVNCGARLTKSYNLDSEYEEIIFEIRFQTDAKFRQQVTENAEMEKKQNQVKQIKELDMLNQKMQMQTLHKLQQLRGDQRE